MAAVQPGHDPVDGIPADDLAGLRVRIDAIDDELVGLLARRYAVTRAVGRYKAEHGMPPSDAVREAEVEAKVRRLAAAYGLSADLVGEVIRTVVADVVREHTELREA